MKNHDIENLILLKKKYILLLEELKESMDAENKRYILDQSDESFSPIIYIIFDSVSKKTKSFSRPDEVKSYVRLRKIKDSIFNRTKINLDEQV